MFDNDYQQIIYKTKTEKKTFKNHCFLSKKYKNCYSWKQSYLTIKKFTKKLEMLKKMNLSAGS